jgi:hypothetical protein
MGLRTSWDKLYRAVATLATADAPLKERLASAFHSHLLGLTPQEFSDAGLQTDFESLYVNAETGKVLRTEWLSEEECQREVGIHKDRQPAALSGACTRSSGCRGSSR